MIKFKKGDEIIVLTGKDKGKKGTVLSISNSKVLVENINLAKKHVKSNPNKGVTGGIIDKEMPIHISNIAIFNNQTNKKDKIGFKCLEDGKKVRFFKSNNEIIDI
ncbi:MAG: 50S ribosomal protein L24 [Methylococcales bacterium]|jgi:large subunit ribosomal protein L24|nr:50S ribosomal protein L24 [Methylococcales bacterium]